jgi:hypothetical protein
LGRQEFRNQQVTLPLSGYFQRCPKQDRLETSKMSRRTKRYFAATAAMLLAVLLPAPETCAGQPTEYQVKAAFLYHFAQFVDWPASAFAQSNAPLVIGVLGNNPFGNDLQQAVDGKVLNQHPLVFHQFGSLAEITNNCHILFISSSESKRLPQIFAGLSGSSILTVGESERFIEAGGMIHFVPEGSRIRFRISGSAVKNAGLKMSSKLLNLASQVTQ